MDLIDELCSRDDQADDEAISYTFRVGRRTIVVRATTLEYAWQVLESDNCGLTDEEIQGAELVKIEGEL